MNARKPLTDEQGEVRELTARDFQRMKPAADILPTELLAALPPHIQPFAPPKKVHVELQLDADIIAAFHATGEGWQTRLNDVLRKILQAGAHAKQEGQD